MKDAFIGNNYGFNETEIYANNNNFNLSEYGNNLVGEQFVVLKADDDIVISFILVGFSSSYIYQCIYNDLI